jgi:hypothetical protein
VTSRAIAHARLRNSRLVGSPLASPAEVVAWFGAVQAQDPTGALWALAQRLPPEPEPAIGEVGAAMDEGSIVRTHALRPTWHFLHPSDLRWIQALTAPRVHRANGTIHRRIGLGDREFELAEAVMRDVLAGGRALTRAELGAALASRGIDVGESLVATYLAMHAELEALICNGPRRGSQSTYQLVDERVPPSIPIDRDAALRELAIRYFRSHGPALDRDMAWWSGLTVSDVRRGIELARGVLEERPIDGRTYWAAAGGFEPAELPRSHVLLLSNYDEYLGSYVDYSPIVDANLPRPNWINDSIGAHVVIRDGLLVGGWRRAVRRDRVTLTVTRVVTLSAADQGALEEQAAALGRFLGLAAELRVVAA